MTRVFLIATMATALVGTLASADGEQPIRALVVTGGHDFEREPFHAMLGALEGIECTELAHPSVNELYVTGGIEQYDVVVLYDLYQDITPEQKAALLARIKGGLGIVGLHHSIADYEAWPAWRAVFGGHYWIAEHEKRGEKLPPSTFQHGIDIPVHIASPSHPITRGMSDFVIHDEVYGNYDVSPDVEVLLTTTQPLSSPFIGWAHTVGEGRVAYVQLGHDHEAYENESYRQLVGRAIRWAAKRLN